MRAFADLFHALDASTSQLAKQAALRAYLRAAAPADAAWAVYFLAGGKPRQLVPTRVLRRLAREAAGLPEWLFEESYEAVGDLAETIALLLPPPTETDTRSVAEWLQTELLPLRGAPPDVQQARLLAQWQRLAPRERLPYFKLITGAFRVGVSRLQVTQALAAVAGLDPKQVAQRLMGYTHVGAQPSAADYAALVAPHDAPSLLGERGGQPYPFFLAHPLNEPRERFDALLGPPQDWLVEWKWDGIRAQVVRRDGQAWIWSRGEELVTDRYPELAAMAAQWPEGTVLDGEIVVWVDPDSIAGRADMAPPGMGLDPEAAPTETSGGPHALAPIATAARHDAVAVLAGAVRPFAELQRRIGRKSVTPKLLREQPVALLAYDLLEWDGQDQRALPQRERRSRLEALVVTQHSAALHLSPRVQGDSWADLARQREAARRLGTEGFMLKRLDTPYGVGRTKAPPATPLVDAASAHPADANGSSPEREATDVPPATPAPSAAASLSGWWKWKIDPMSVDAVLIYAQRGHGRRASLYTDYTFAVWSGPVDDAERTLVPFAKAYSGLTDAEIARVDAIVRKTTRESFGPVRSVTPTLVFELGFEGIARSARHKSGIAVRFPRMLRWRQDKPVTEADTLATLQALMPS